MSSDGTCETVVMIADSAVLTGTPRPSFKKFFYFRIISNLHKNCKIGQSSIVVEQSTADLT